MFPGNERGSAGDVHPIVVTFSWSRHNFRFSLCLHQKHDAMKYTYAAIAPFSMIMRNLLRDRAPAKPRKGNINLRFEVPSSVRYFMLTGFGHLPR